MENSTLKITLRSAGAGFQRLTLWSGDEFTVAKKLSKNAMKLKPMVFDDIHFHYEKVQVAGVEAKIVTLEWAGEMTVLRVDFFGKKDLKAKKR